MEVSIELPGECRQCGTLLARAAVREIRHYEETRLLKVTCLSCEDSFLAVLAQTRDVIDVDEVVAAEGRLRNASTLSELGLAIDLDAPLSD